LIKSFILKDYLISWKYYLYPQISLSDLHYRRFWY